MQSLLLTILTWCMCAGLNSAAATPKLPFEICRPTSRPDFDACVAQAIPAALKSLVKGYPPLGVFPVEPLHITAIDIDQGSGPISINLKFRELDISGISQATVTSFKSDLKNLVFKGNVSFPQLLLNGQYTIDGKVLILPIKGNGRADLKLDALTANFILNGKHFKKDGKTYMKVQKFTLGGVDTHKLTMNFENLFNGDKALGANMNKFLNENAQDILKELKPAITETFGVALGEISNRMFTKVPYYDIFPDN